MPKREKQKFNSKEKGKFVGGYITVGIPFLFN